MKNLKRLSKIKYRTRRKRKVLQNANPVTKEPSKKSTSEISNTISAPIVSTVKKSSKPFNKKAFAIATLRRASYRLRSRNEAMSLARIERGKYKCAHCDKIFGRKEIQLDHVSPVIPVTGWVSWDDYIDRMFPETADGWQVLCKNGCHKAKTAVENEQRKLQRQSKKKLAKKALNKINKLGGNN